MLFFAKIKLTIHLWAFLLFQDASGAMKSLVWHKDQEDVCALLLAIVAQAQT